MLGIRKKGQCCQIVKLLSEIAVYAMEKAPSLPAPLVFVMPETSDDKAIEADQQGNACVEMASPVHPGQGPTRNEDPCLPRTGECPDFL
jgi:hypothetical protein